MGALDRAARPRGQPASPAVGGARRLARTRPRPGGARETKAGEPIDRRLVRRWREAEGAYFAQSFAEPGMYETALAVVRGLADGLADVATEADLENAYEERGPDWAETRVEELNLAQGAWLELAGAREVAFNLRLGEICAAHAARDTAARLAEARAAGETWLVAVDGETGFAGWRTYRRVDIHATSGVALYGYSSRDWDGGIETLWFEVLRVDPQTGAPIRGAAPLRKARTCRDRPALLRAFGAARRRYGGT